ncbi:MAG TPA: outer membrane protein assembly factor BamD [Cyclobacteriaceae bacterium]|nr:outer membrane protein assembly factor BamD [Cyclobacteriaceae bacterium]
MTLHPRLSYIILLFIAFYSASCSKFRKIQKSNDWELKYRAAMEYYENKEYYKASTLLEELLPIIRGRPEAEKAQFYFAYSYYYQKQYLLSAHYFQTFFELYSRSEYAQEAFFMYAYSLYLDSPNYNLDQSNTIEAIQAIQTFLNKYPRSKYREQANLLIDEMQVKLEEKAYQNAYLYYRLQKYLEGEGLKAALIAFENFQNDYPDSRFNEKICYLKVECSYRIARKSIRSRQKERLERTIEYYLYFIDKFPQSPMLRDAENIYSNCLDDLEKLNQNNL